MKLRTLKRLDGAVSLHQRNGTSVLTGYYATRPTHSHNELLRLQFLKLRESHTLLTIPLTSRSALLQTHPDSPIPSAFGTHLFRLLIKHFSHNLFLYFITLLSNTVPHFSHFTNSCVSLRPILIFDIFPPANNFPALLTVHALA